MAGLIESPRRGHHKITARGLEVLRQEPDRIDNTFLRKFPEFEESLEMIKVGYRANEEKLDVYRKLWLRS